MNKKKWIISMILGSVLLFGAGIGVGAAGSEPGSNGDPLITKSYLDNQIAQVQKDGMYKEVSLAAGKKLVCDAGAQVIVVSGGAKTTAALVDVTEGTKSKKGTKVELYHSYLMTSNSTGVKATKSAKVFVSGNYTVK